MSILVESLKTEESFEPMPEVVHCPQKDGMLDEPGIRPSTDPFLLALEIFAMPLFLFSPEGDIVFVNVAGTDYVAGFAAEDHMEFSKKVRSILFNMIDGASEAKGHFGGAEIQVRTIPYGGEVLFSVQVEPLPDISEDDLKYLAYHDELTGMKNFRAYNKAMKAMKNTNVLNKSTEVMAMVLIDVDDFKSINDSLGHTFGNHVLKQIGQFFKESIRSYDEAFRIGGDEFAILSYQCSSNKAQEWAYRIHEALTSHLRKITENPYISLSMGFSILDNSCLSEEYLFEKADRTLYQAKDSGKDKIVV